MPIFDYQCKDCEYTWESIEVWKSHAPTECPNCKSPNFDKIISISLVRPNSDGIIRSVPDPSPPLEELRGKTKPGCDGGYADKPYADTQLKNYVRRKDKHGNTLWEEKRKQYFDMGRTI